jgi:hypothetical protein
MTKLSDTQSIILSQASRHEALLATAPANLPAAARQAVFRSMLKNLLLEEVSALVEHGDLGWRLDEEGAPLPLRITGCRFARHRRRNAAAVPRVPRTDRCRDEHELDLQQEALAAENAVARALGEASPVAAAARPAMGLREAHGGLNRPAWESIGTIGGCVS